MTRVIPLGPTRFDEVAPSPREVHVRRKIGRRRVVERPWMRWIKDKGTLKEIPAGEPDRHLRVLCKAPYADVHSRVGVLADEPKCLDLPAVAGMWRVCSDPNCSSSLVEPCVGAEPERIAAKHRAGSGRLGTWRQRSAPNRRRAKERLRLAPARECCQSRRRCCVVASRRGEGCLGVQSAEDAAEHEFSGIAAPVLPQKLTDDAGKCEASV